MSVMYSSPVVYTSCRVTHVCQLCGHRGASLYKCLAAKRGAAAGCYFMDLFFVCGHAFRVCCCSGGNNLFLASDIKAYPLQWQRPYEAATAPGFDWTSLFVLYWLITRDTLCNRNWAAQDTVSHQAFVFFCFFKDYFMASCKRSNTDSMRRRSISHTVTYSCMSSHLLICREWPCFQSEHEGFLLSGYRCGSGHIRWEYASQICC